ncbi:hypothetical protein [Lysobacter gummosus]
MSEPVSRTRWASPCLDCALYPRSRPLRRTRPMTQRGGSGPSGRSIS